MIDKFEKYIGKKLSQKSKELLLEFNNFMTKKIRYLDTPKNIAFIHEDVGHLTGGRYYAMFIASALLEAGHNVTIYSNKVPIFMGEFKSYRKPRIILSAMNAKQLSRIDVKADVYIGSPINGALAATRLGEKYKKPAFALIFDPFPMMEKYLGKKMYLGWEELLTKLRTTNTNIISLCNTTSEYIYGWLNKTKEQVFPVYPCINSKILDSKKRDYTNKEDYVVFISRMVRHKKFDDVLSAVSKTKMKLKVISSVSGMNYNHFLNQSGIKNKVEFYWKINDDKKFDLIAKSRGVIVGSIFEGFGLFVSEAIACGVPFIGYDYPTFREIKDYAKVNNIYLAQYKNVFDLGRKLQLAVRERKYNKPSQAFHFERMIEVLKEI